ncbi:MAG: PfaD family polyunsaturated fatty acid/polyketide biosynthesis protein [Polyangiaceae bacterium]|nr:PfaD family polyunsaturated fatty acid/polyketide biosynthesis protein [Polyangiaceae bacterium]
MADRISRAVFLVSGGARGVTAECVVGLARAQGGSFLLLGRTPANALPGLDDRAPEEELRRQIASQLAARGEKASPIAVERVLRGVRARAEIARTIERIERAGGRALYRTADVTDGASVRRAIEDAGLGRVSGIIHGAGTLADRRIESKSDQDIQGVYATKIHGLRAMLSCVDGARLSHLALFSSTSGFHGNVGQSDYAAANEVLNKVAHAFARRFPACRTVVFDWGPWDGGMVTPFLRSVFESRGVRVMPVEDGVRVFVDVLRGERTPVQLLVNDVGSPLGKTEPAGAPPARRAPLLRVFRTIELERNRFLRDHVIGGHPVMPAACAGLWMANVCQLATPGFQAVSVADFRVLKGLVFDGTAPDRYLLELKDEATSDGTVEMSALLSSTTRDQKKRYHYRCKVLLAREPLAPPAPRAPSPAGDPDVSTLRPYADGSLFHGPAFQVIARVLRIGPSQISTRCHAPNPAAGLFGQFPPIAFDAVALDAQFQSVGLWAHHTLGVAVLPTSWARYEVFSPLPRDGSYFVTAEIEEKGEFVIRASILVQDGRGQVLARVTGAEFTVHRPAAAQEEVIDTKAVVASLFAPGSKVADAEVSLDRKGIQRALRDVDRAAFVVKSGMGAGVTRDRRRGEEARSRGELLAELAANPPERLGAASFRREYGVGSAYMAGAMAKGIATEELVIALGRAGFLGSFGAGGLSIERIEAAVVRIQQALPTGPHAFNLLHSPRKLATEEATVDVYLRHGVRTVEASSYLDLTPSIVRYRVAGLEREPDGRVVARNRVIAKLSRLELARRFLAPPPGKMLQELLEAGRISREQAELASQVPMADDLTVEADSGGHTDNRPLVVLLPAMLALRDEAQREHRYRAPVRVGAAGGIGTPHAVLAAFSMGADYVVTGSINQACVESGTSEHVKRLLATVEITDVAMAPESDMFENGVRVQVVKQRTLYPMRAQKLHHCYLNHASLEAIPGPVRGQLEQQIFGDTLEHIWEQTAAHLAAHRPEQLERAKDPKVKMALLFKWYLGQSSRWAVEGAPGRELDYQIWCGPAMGAFNGWARGTYLESPENRRVADIARVLMREAAYLSRVQQLRLGGIAEGIFSEVER